MPSVKNSYFQSDLDIDTQLNVMKIENLTFNVSIQTADGESIAELITIEIPMEWDEEVHEWLMTDEGLQKVKETKARHMGLVQPVKIRALR
jgi:hypothetical protein